MRIDLTNSELHEILSEHFKLKEGDNIRLNYVEPTNIWRKRINYEEVSRNIKSTLELPEKINHYLWL